MQSNRLDMGNRLDMAHLRMLAAWGAAIKSLAGEFSEPSVHSLTFRGLETSLIIGVVMSIVEEEFDSMTPAELDSMLRAFAQRLNVEVEEDTHGA